MSAYALGERHVDLLVSATLDRSRVEPVSEIRVVLLGSALRAANRRGVEERYGERVGKSVGELWELPSEVYALRRVPLSAYSAVEALKALACFEYQSLEIGDWDSAARPTDGWRAALAECERHLGRLPLHMGDDDVSQRLRLARVRDAIEPFGTGALRDWIEWLRASLIQALPGYDAAPWEWTGPTVSKEVRRG